MTDYSDYIVPCKDCQDRRVTANYNCHSDCEKYISFKRIRDARAKQLAKEKDERRRQDEACIKRGGKKSKYKWGRYRQ